MTDQLSISLSTIMRIFDPLGLMSPFRIRGHIIMQNVWKAGSDWKERPPSELCRQFQEWLKDFEMVTLLEIPRCYSPIKLSEASLTLHVFVDAGVDAYAACVYLHIQYGDAVCVRLVAAKARVTPIKYLSIPKQELMSAVLGARLLNSVMKWHRRLNFVDYTCWTDSEVTYKWIVSHHPHKNRVHGTTHRGDQGYNFRRQMATRSYKERIIDYSNHTHEWFVGPEFLYRPEAEWPKSSAKIKDCELVMTISTKNVIVAEDESLIGITNVSANVRANWSLYGRVTAKALRFADHVSIVHPRNQLKGLCSPEEIERAENYLIRKVQSEVYKKEYARLAAGKNSKLASLSVFMCPHHTQLIRCRTRLGENFPFNTRAPPILPNNHELTDSIVRHYHQKHMHVGDNALIGSLRTRVWVVSAKRAVRRCRARVSKSKNSPPPTEFADLPDFRLDISQKPFYYTGSDLFGPLDTYVGRSRHTRQVWIIIFTCLVTRAIYLEVLDEMSTECFLMALDKLWARRGPLKHLYTDNGRNYIGGAAILANDKFQNSLLERKLVWHFSPPYTPQFGGTWERLIKDIKRGLEASIGKCTVSRISLESIIARIESNVNSRPLTDIPVSSLDDAPLTPYLLMTGHPNHPVLD
jgi:Pao retrotransposon peptidase